MPIYEYRCTACGHELEALQRFADAPLTHCPACEKETLSKLVSAAGFQLKGSGWYVTDFRNSGSKPAGKTGSKDGNGTTGEGDTAKTAKAADDKPAAAGESKTPAASTPAADKPASDKPAKASGSSTSNS